jgi:hypothetical protein
MRPGSRLRRARAGCVVVVVSAAAACGASPALAATSTVSVANDTATPEQAVPTDLTISGTNGSTSAAYVAAVVRPAGGLACQASYAEDISTLGGEDTTVVGPGGQAIPPGAYAVAANFKPSSPGSYQVCAWLSQSSDGTNPLAAPATVGLAARGPQVTQLTVSVPKGLQPGVPFQVTYTTQTDQQLSLFSVLAPAGPAACAPAFEQQAHALTTIRGVGHTPVYGGPTSTAATVTEKTGSYVICTWVEGPSGSEVDGSDATSITVGTPQPGLHLGRVTASRRHGIAVAGSSAYSFSGRVLVQAACGRSRARSYVSARNESFAAHIRAPAGCRSARRVTVTASWGGSTAWGRQSTSRTVALTR